MKTPFNKFLILLSQILIMTACSTTPKNNIETFYVRDFGASPSSKNVRLALDKAVNAAAKINGPTEIIFEPNKIYQISLPDNIADQTKYAWTISNVTNLTINGQGATLLVTNPKTGAILTKDSKNISVKNLKIDYEPLPYSQGIITKVDISNYWFEMKIDNNFPEPNLPYFEEAIAKWGLTICTQKNKRHIYGPTPVFTKKWEKTGERTWRFFPQKNFAGYKNLLLVANLKPGEKYIHMARNWSQAVAAINCNHILWENITVFSSPGLAFFPYMTSYHTIRNCHVKIKKGRIFSTNADGIHMRSSRGNVLIENCSFEGMADDAINLHSSALSIQEQPATNQVLVKKHTFSVRKGDKLLLVHSASAKLQGTFRVENVEDKGANWLITLDKNLPNIKIGNNFGASDNMYNLSEIASPFVIRNCTFNDFRGRGILVSSQNGLIENNIFNLNEGWGVVFSYESVRWAEGPLAKNITVKNNVFKAGTPEHQPAILAHIFTREGEQVDGKPYCDINIENNKFYVYKNPVIQLDYAKNVNIISNQISYFKKSNPIKLDEKLAVKLNNCENVNINSMTFDK